MAPAIVAGLQYFAAVFSTGFLLGSIRLSFVVPRLGTRAAELLELPFMIAASVVAAKWIVRRQKLPATPKARFTMGGLGFLWMLVAEFGLVIWLRSMTIPEYLATRDPVSGTGYYLALILFAAMPAIVGRGRSTVR